MMVTKRILEGKKGAAGHVQVTRAMQQASTGMFAAGMSDESLPEQVAIDLLDDNPYQPRETIEEDSLLELAQVIKTQGFQGVLVARPHPEQPGRYQLTSGHRRREAARRVDLFKLPVVVREVTNRDMAILAATENLQRKDLNPLEEGRLFVRMQEELGLTQEEIAASIGLKRGYVTNRLIVARSPEDVQAFVLRKPDVIRAVATLRKEPDPVRRAEMIRGLEEGTLTADDLRGYMEAGVSGPTSSDSAASPVRSASPPTLGVTDTPAHSASGVTAPVAPTPLPEQPEHVAGDGGKRQKTPRRVVPPEHAHVDARVGSGKLKDALQKLTTYAAGLPQRASISLLEQQLLEQIATTLEQIRTAVPKEC